MTIKSCVTEIVSINLIFLYSYNKIRVSEKIVRLYKLSPKA